MSNHEKVDAWMPLWIGAYLADTMNLSTQQHGAYLLLLFAYWRNRGPLVDDDEDLANIARAPAAEWKRLRPKIERFFTVAGGMWSHGRADTELANAGQRKAKATSKAKAGAEALWKKRREQPDYDAPSIASSTATSVATSIGQAMHGQCPTPSPTPSPSESSEAKASAASGSKPKETDPETIIFGYGVPLLTAAGNEDKHARSFLGGLRKHHGDAALIDKLRECIKVKPLQPLEWLAAALPPDKALDAPKPEPAWHETKRGVIAKGAEFGFVWSEDGWVGGEFMQFPVFRARVFSAAGHNPRAAA